VGRICLYYRDAQPDRWFPGDRFVRPIARRLLRGRSRPGGVDKVFINLSLGLTRLGIQCEKNLPFRQLRPDDKVGVLGRGRHSLEGYSQPNPIVAGIGLMSHPSEWPTLCTEYHVVRYLQHSDWVNNIYKPYFGERCVVWPVGIDTDEWKPASDPKEVDFLIYDKILWERDRQIPQLLQPILTVLNRQKFTYSILRYGDYDADQYKACLLRCRAMIFLCEHESQGLAYQEALSSGVPIFAWDQGWWLDPNRFKWGEKDVPATSVPYFDERCGLTFRDIHEFETTLTAFIDLLNAGRFAPRDFVLENLTLEKCARRYLDILDEAAQEP